MDAKRVKECALYYARIGWQVLPLCYPIGGECSCGRAAAGKDCKAGKAPHYTLCPNGSKDATSDAAEIAKWFDLDLEFNIGVCAGEASGLVILDIDPGHGGSLEGRVVPHTPEVITGSGGGHLYFAHPGGEIRNSSGTIGNGLDVRGHHGYVVAPPSLHPCGEEYRWKLDPRAPLAAMPSWITKKKGKATASVKPGEPVGEGKRNDTMMRMLSSLCARGVTKDVALATALADNEARYDPPMDDVEVEAIAESVYSNYKANPVEEDETPSGEAVPVKDDRPSTIAAAFLKDAKVLYHYNSIDQFSIYSKDMWQKIKDERELNVYIRRFIVRCRVKRQKKKGDGWETWSEPVKKEGDGYVRDIRLSIAATPTVHLLPGHKAPTSFDNALNPETTIALKNGLLDVRENGKYIIKPFTPDFYTFNYLPVAYDPDATVEVITKMLGYYFTEDDRSIPDTVAQDVVYSWFKRIIFRVMEPHKIMVFLGSMRSGKSTLGRILLKMMGKLNVAPITIAQLAYTHGLYSLMNKQVGIMWDAKITGRFGDVSKAVEVLKNISGQDMIAVNPKRKDIIDMDAMRLNIVMIANKMADLKDDTGALASRFTFLKTTQSFLGHEDPTMEAFVIKHELPGILNKVLAAPNSILEHPKSPSISQEFAEMSSPFTAFIEDCCTLNDQYASIPADYLWAYYCDWCEGSKQRQPKKQNFKPDFFAAAEGPYGITKKNPRIGDGDISEYESEHRITFRPGPKLRLSERALIYYGIDVIADIKGTWYDPRESSENEGLYKKDW